MRWIITDRATGEVVKASQPQNNKEAQALKAAIKARSALAMRGGPLYDL